MPGRAAGSAERLRDELYLARTDLEVQLARPVVRLVILDSAKFADMAVAVGAGSSAPKSEIAHSKGAGHALREL